LREAFLEGEDRLEITTALLDAGGVILDETEHERVRVEIAVEALRGVVPGYSEQQLYCDLDEAIRVFCPRVLAYTLWKRVGPDMALFEKIYAWFRSQWGRRRPPLKLMPGLEEELRVLSAGLDVGIAGQYGGDLLELLKENALLDYFRYSFTQDDFEITKPDPRYLERIAEACGVETGRCIMVGDRIDNDIIPARQLGMKTVRIRVGLHRRQEPRIPSEVPDAELDGIRGLGQTVLKIAARS
jgi:putative hydrolase of the HAD superfamily